MLTTMTDEKAPEGMETKDVHTGSGGTFQGTEQGVPGYHPAAVPNRNQTTINGGEAVHEQGLRQPATAEEGSGDGGDAPADESGSSSGSSSSSAKSTATKTSGRSTSASKSS
jgi:hypothetical protein